LVDDVLTTGATLASCIRAIYAAAPDCKVSVVTLAVAGTIKA
jgi:predicted amidophosphoribosyltransferase